MPRRPCHWPPGILAQSAIITRLLAETNDTTGCVPADVYKRMPKDKTAADLVAALPAGLTRALPDGTITIDHAAVRELRQFTRDAAVASFPRSIVLNHEVLCMVDALDDAGTTSLPLTLWNALLAPIKKTLVVVRFRTSDGLLLKGHARVRAHARQILTDALAALWRLVTLRDVTCTSAVEARRVVAVARAYGVAAVHDVRDYSIVVPERDAGKLHSTDALLAQCDARRKLLARVRAPDAPLLVPLTDDECAQLKTEGDASDGLVVDTVLRVACYMPQLDASMAACVKAARACTDAATTATAPPPPPMETLAQGLRPADIVLLLDARWDNAFLRWRPCREGLRARMLDALPRLERSDAVTHALWDLLPEACAAHRDARPFVLASAQRGDAPWHIDTVNGTITRVASAGSISPTDSAKKRAETRQRAIVAHLQRVFPMALRRADLPPGTTPADLAALRDAKTIALVTPNASRSTTERWSWVPEVVLNVPRAANLAKLF